MTYGTTLKNIVLDMGDQFLRDLVGNAATCVTIIMFLCAMPTIGQINRQRAVPLGFNVYPYAFTAVLATLWWYYGAIIQVYYSSKIVISLCKTVLKS